MERKGRKREEKRKQNQVFLARKCLPRLPRYENDPATFNVPRMITTFDLLFAPSRIRENMREQKGKCSLATRRERVNF